MDWSMVDSRLRMVGADGGGSFLLAGNIEHRISKLPMAFCGEDQILARLEPWPRSPIVLAQRHRKNVSAR